MLQLHTVKMGEEVQRTGSGPIYPMHVLPDVETIPLILNMFDQCFLLLQGVSGEVSPFFFWSNAKCVALSPTRSLTMTHIFHIKLSWNISVKHLMFV